jgi:adenosylhomocysteine nucleosidase
MAILYVAGEAAELQPVAQVLINLRKLKWPLDYAYEGILDGKRIILAANGAGPRLAAQAVETAVRAISVAELSASKLEAVVSTGFCGALDRSLREDQIVIGTSLIDAQTGDATPCDVISPLPEGVASGAVVSQDRIAGRAEEKQALSKCGAIAVDMEAAGVQARTKRAGLPFYCIKVVSDRADETFGLDLNNLRTTEGRIARGKIGIHALSHPSVLPELFRLKRRSERAAKALGEFLVSCRIKPEQDSSLAG